MEFQSGAVMEVFVSSWRKGLMWWRQELKLWVLSPFPMCCFWWWPSRSRTLTQGAAWEGEKHWMQCPSVNQGRFAEESLSSMQDLHVVCSQEAAFETPGKAVAYRLWACRFEEIMGRTQRLLLPCRGNNQIPSSYQPTFSKLTSDLGC